MSKKKNAGAPEEFTQPPVQSLDSVETGQAAETPLPPALPSPDTIAAYQTLYDQLGRAYWEASEIRYKDTIQGARDAVYEILSELNRAKLDGNTDALLALEPKIKASNKALSKIKGKISSITKNISTASSVIEAIAKVISIAA